MYAVACEIWINVSFKHNHPTFGSSDSKICFDTANSIEAMSSSKPLRWGLFGSTRLNQAMTPSSMTWGFHVWPSYQAIGPWLADFMQNQLSWNFTRSRDLKRFYTGDPVNSIVNPLATSFLMALKSHVNLRPVFALKSRVSPSHHHFFHLFLPHSLTPLFSGEPSLQPVMHWKIRRPCGPMTIFVDLFNIFRKFAVLHRIVNHSRFRREWRYGWSWFNQSTLISRTIHVEINIWRFTLGSIWKGQVMRALQKMSLGWCLHQSFYAFPSFPKHFLEDNSMHDFSHTNVLPQSWATQIPSGKSLGVSPSWLGASAMYSNVIPAESFCLELNYRRPQTHKPFHGFKIRQRLIIQDGNWSIAFSTTPSMRNWISTTPTTSRKHLSKHGALQNLPRAVRDFGPWYISIW